MINNSYEHRHTSAFFSKRTPSLHGYCLVDRYLRVGIYLQGGRGDSIQLAFHYGGIPFADERVTYEQLGKIKESLPFGQVPVLTINEKTVIPQEGAILRYVGRLTGAYLADKEKALNQDIVLNVFGDGRFARITY